MQQNFKKIYSGFFIDFCGSFINLITSFIVLQFYFSYITREDYGIWLAIFGLASMIGLVDIGVDQYYLTIIPNDEKFYNSSFSSDLTNYLFSKLLIIVIFLIVSLFIQKYLFTIISIPNQAKDISENLFMISTILLLFNVFSSTLTTILYGRSDFSLINLVTNVGLFLSNFITLSLLNLNFGLISFPYALLIVSIIQFFVLLIFVLKKYPHLKFGKVKLHGQLEMIRYSFSFQILKWAYLIRTQSLVLILNNLIGPSAVTKYSITNRIPQMVPTYLGKMVMPLFPSYTKLYNENDLLSIRKISLKLFKILSRFGIFSSFGIIIFNQSFITLWMGYDFFAGFINNIIIAVYIFIVSITSGFGIVIYSSKKFEKWPFLSILEIFLTIFLSLFLGKIYGFFGILTGFLIGSMITQLYLSIIALNQLNINLFVLFRNTAYYVFIPNILSIFIGTLLFFTISINSWLTFMLCFLVYTISHFLVFELVRFLNFEGKGFKNRLLYTFDI